jgi:hypothetical protein
MGEHKRITNKKLRAANRAAYEERKLIDQPRWMIVEGRDWSWGKKYLRMFAAQFAELAKGRAVPA